MLFDHRHVINWFSTDEYANERSFDIYISEHRDELGLLLDFEIDAGECSLYLQHEFMLASSMTPSSVFCALHIVPRNRLFGRHPTKNNIHNIIYSFNQT